MTAAKTLVRVNGDRPLIFILLKAYVMPGTAFPTDAGLVLEPSGTYLQF